MTLSAGKDVPLAGDTLPVSCCQRYESSKSPAMLNR